VGKHAGDDSVAFCFINGIEFGTYKLNGSGVNAFVGFFVNNPSVKSSVAHSLATTAPRPALTG
jgi:hypothetical protein